MTGKMPVLEEMKANIERARDQIKRLTTVAHKLAKERDALTKERDELAEDNVKLQVETMEWQNMWYEMKVALKQVRKQTIYVPKRSQRIKENLKRKNLKRKK